MSILWTTDMHRLDFWLFFKELSLYQNNHNIDKWFKKCYNIKYKEGGYPCHRKIR